MDSVCHTWPGLEKSVFCCNVMGCKMPLLARDLAQGRNGHRQKTKQPSGLSRTLSRALNMTVPTAVSPTVSPDCQRDNLADCEPDDLADRQPDRQPDDLADRQPHRPTHRIAGQVKPIRTTVEQP